MKISFNPGPLKQANEICFSKESKVTQILFLITTLLISIVTGVSWVNTR